ncbi:MAG: IPT/TIG domain-containing protein, partial [Sandaracinaceae bacterium]|nr:IPT/TIG domain-containing protein [Sandaracinaceae bacterium]
MYRGARPDRIAIDAVVPRRVQRNVPEVVTITALGVPTDATRVRVFVGNVPCPITQIQSNDAEERSAIVFARVPGLPVEGQYDVTLRVNKGRHLGGKRCWWVVWWPTRHWCCPRHHSGAPDPGWYHGHHPRPGLRTWDRRVRGLSLLFGGVPVQQITVLSTREMQVMSPAGRVGRNAVRGTDRYGNASTLDESRGYGYGLRQIGQQSLGLFPGQIHVDQASG